MKKRDYKKEAAWLKARYDDIRIKVPKQLGMEFREKLKSNNETITSWGKENIKKYIDNH